MTVLIAGGGIAGLTLGLTCHQLGIPFKIFEAVEKIKPLGVGINLQPNAVRELYDLGLEAQIDAIGVRTRDYGLYTKSGLHIWTEPRGTWAGYNWPQYSVHRGYLHVMLLEVLQERAGTNCIETGWTVVGFENTSQGASLSLKNRDGQIRTEHGKIVIGADGIHSNIRKQMNPDEEGPRWGGTVLWRGTSFAKPFKSGASMVMIGKSGLRFVSYPISKPDPKSGIAEINWIANLTYEKGQTYNKEDYSREANLSDFFSEFEDFDLDWIDVPGLIMSANKIYEYPMVDREPLDAWTDGCVTLMGDAAHAAYPVGSNGAGSAIIDARVLGACWLKFGLTPKALQEYEAKMRPACNAVILMNRTSGPDSIIDDVENRGGGVIKDIHDVMSVEEMAAHANKYKSAAGYGIEDTNSAPSTIQEGAKLDR